VPDELLSRRPEFRPGSQIRLADGQLWTFPAPGDGERLGLENESEYRGLIRVILESEDTSDWRMAELALAIHLLQSNYRLDPPELSHLLTFPSGSSELMQSQRDFEALAVAHIRFVLEAQGATFPAQEPVRTLPRHLPALAWLRAFLSRRGSDPRNARTAL
jgi:hypothetical protein